jgi:plastocyanin
MKILLSVCYFVIALVTIPPVFGGAITVNVKDIKGASISDAVVYAKPIGGTPKPGEKKKSAVIDQQNQQYVPYVTAIQVGTAVTFPNKDNIRHHVYSFSPAKKFELPLYAGVPAEPVLFDKEGFVTLGCNIHDWMLAHVAVLDTPYFQVTRGPGTATLSDLAAGSYRVEVWQPRMKVSPEKLSQTVELSGTNKELTFIVDLKPDFKSKKSPPLKTGAYR